MQQMLKTLLIDDEPLARQLVRKYLESFPAVEIVGECENGFDGIKKIQELKPDLIFLDVQMPKLNGFEMLELMENPPYIIFTTAYDQFAIKAFEMNAIDYLLKPFSLERFKQSLEKAFEKFGQNSHETDAYESLLSASNKEKLEKILIKEGAKIHVLPVQDVEVIEAQDDYVLIHANGKKFLKQKTMKFFEERLDETEFVRIHRSFFVASRLIKQIDLLEKESYQITLQNGQKLPVSKSGYQKLKALFQ